LLDRFKNESVKLDKGFANKSRVGIVQGTRRYRAVAGHAVKNKNKIRQLESTLCLINATLQLLTKEDISQFGGHPLAALRLTQTELVPIQIQGAFWTSNGRK
jgi:hypothetical protein